MAPILVLLRACLNLPVVPWKAGSIQTDPIAIGSKVCGSG